MRIKRVLSLAVLLFAASEVAEAQTYVGPSGTSCTDYLATPQGSSTRMIMDSYVQGYVSGFNAVVHAVSQKDPLGPESPRDVIGFLRGYCRSNPFNTLLNGANNYMGSLHQNMLR
jgi:hypothetical protein